MLKNTCGSVLVLLPVFFLLCQQILLEEEILSENVEVNSIITVLFAVIT